METRHKDLVSRGESLFSKRTSLMKLWQDVAEQFYVERADFTVCRSLGDDFASHLTTSYPMLARRDLGNSLAGLLRQDDWFAMGVVRGVNTHDGKAWLEWATKLQKRAMYDRRSLFVRATKEGDHDFATFGQCAISVELNKNQDGLIYRNWHLRDLAWCENDEGVIDSVFLKWKASARVLNDLFKGNVHDKVKRALEKDPYTEFNCMRIVVPAEGYEGGKYRRGFVSLWLDIDNGHCMEEVNPRTMPFVIPRWQTVSGSQYAYSPATVCALPDARLIQAMTLTLLEAGEKAVTPPMIAVQEAIRSDVSLYAGGITWVDSAYDERLGEVLRPLNIDKSGMPVGMELRDSVRESIMEAFFLNKLTLPVMAGDMTATEVSQRVQEYIRQALPIFEPMEPEYNGALCERTFDVLLNAGAFGPPDSIPDELRGQEVMFKFESPLQEAAGRKKAQTFLEAKALLAAAVEADPSTALIVDFKKALREALEGAGVPTDWTNDEDTVADMEASQMQAAQQQQLMATLGQGAQVAEQFGKASQAFAA